MFGKIIALFGLLSVFGISIIAQNQSGKTASEEVERLQKIASDEFDKKNYQRAAEYYNQIIAIDPLDPQAYLGRGASTANRGDLERANADYSRVIEICSRHIDSGSRDYRHYALRAIAYSNKQEYGASLKDYTSAIALAPQQVFLYYDRARVYEFLGQNEPAKMDRRKYTELGGTERTPQPANALFPSSTFDITAAKNALSRGNGAIEGIVCTNLRSGIYRADGVRVSLYPVTPYLDEWYKLREKRESKSLGVFMSYEANRHRVDVKANEQGRFYFYDLKPGRYFIQTFHDFNTAHAANMYVGSDRTTDYYQTQRWTVAHSKRIEKFVDIKSDTGRVKVTMKKGNRLSLRGCG